MNRLKRARGYLCGAMDRVPDGGEVWRQRLRTSLCDLGIVWLDPTDKPIDLGIEDKESRKLRHQHKQAGLWDEVVKEIRPIRRIDVRMVDISDFMVTHLDMDAHACGTYEETFRADWQDKPCLFHIEQGKSAAPDWLFDRFPHQHIHGTWEGVEAYLRTVANDPYWCDDTWKWIFFDWMGA